MKKQELNKNKWIHIRVNEQEYKTIHRFFEKSTDRKLGSYARKVLLNKPVTINHRNQSSDDTLAVLASLQRSLNGIASNFNQVVKKMHTLKGTEEFRSWYVAFNLASRSTAKEIEEIKRITVKIYEDGHANFDPESHIEGTEL